MKDISQIWFLKSPIDAEQKHYILLAFLQEVNKEIKIDNVYSPIKRIFSLIKELDYFIKSDSLDGFKKLPLTEDDKSIIDFYSKNPISKYENKYRVWKFGGNNKTVYSRKSGPTQFVRINSFGWRPYRRHIFRRLQ
jgi:hypothetical protein